MGPFLFSEIHMLIKFKKPDPRAGMVADMDSSLGQKMIDDGCADAHKEGAAVQAPAAAPAPAVTTESIAKRGAKKTTK